MSLVSIRVRPKPLWASCGLERNVKQGALRKTNVTNEPNLFESLRQKIEQIRRDIERIDFKIDGDLFQSFPGILGRLGEAEKDIDKLQEQYKDLQKERETERLQREAEKRDWKIWRVGLSIALGLTLVVLAILVITALWSAPR